jgi:hypothetical protein
MRSCPSAIGRRSTCRMWASRCASRGDAGSASAAHRRHRLGDRLEAGRPSPRCSMTSSHHRSGSGSPAAAASAANGSPMRGRPTLRRRRRRSPRATAATEGPSPAPHAVVLCPGEAPAIPG